MHDSEKIMRIGEILLEYKIEFEGDGGITGKYSVAVLKKNGIIRLFNDVNYKNNHGFYKWRSVVAYETNPTWDHGAVLINHENKTISRYDSSAESGSRIPKYERREKDNAPTYIIPKNDFSIPQKEFALVSNYLKKYYDGYRVIGGAESNEQLDYYKKILDNFLHEKVADVIAYHGTSSLSAANIQKTGIDSRGDNYSDKLVGHSGHNLYLTLDPNIARRYAIRASGSNEYAILKVKVPDISKIVFDEDNSYEVVTNIVQKRTRADVAICNIIESFLTPDAASSMQIVLKRVLSDDREDGMNYILTNKNFVKYGLKDNIDMSKLKETLLKIRKYIFSKMFFKMKEFSFGYRGKIPPANVEVYETGKSTEYNDEKMDRPSAMQDEYAAMTANTTNKEE